MVKYKTILLFGVLSFVLGLVFLNSGQISAQDVVAREAVTQDNAASVAELGVIDTGTLSILDMAIHPNGQFLLTSHNMGLIHEWDLSSGEGVTIESPSESWVRAVAYSPDGTQIASADESNVILWDAESKEEIATLEGHSDPVSFLAYSPDGTLLASASWDGTIRLWDAESAEELQVIEVGTGVYNLAFSPDGTTLASSDGNFSGVHLWDVSGEDNELDDLLGDESYYSAISFNHDGSLLAAAVSFAADDSQLHIWDLATGDLIHTLTGHDAGITEIQFSPISNIIISTSYDGTVRLWDAENGSVFSPLEGSFLVGYDVAVSLDGGLILSGSADGLVHLWGLEGDSPLSLPEPETFTPNPGHWEFNDPSFISVAFDVTDDGQVENFTWRWDLSGSYCSYEASSVTVEDNAFVISDSGMEITAHFRSDTMLFGRSPSRVDCGGLSLFTTGYPTWWVEWESD